MGSRTISGVYVFASFLFVCLSWNSSIACLTKRQKNFIYLENVTSCGTLAFGVREMINLMGFYADTQIAYSYLEKNKTRIKRKLSTMWTSFSRKNFTIPMSSTCVKRNLPASEQKFRHLAFPLDWFHCTFLLLLQIYAHMNLLYEHREVYLFSALVS
jgi:hypothetical protein